MSDLTGVYTATKKDGSVYYRSSLTYRGKHISLGSFDNELQANYAYNDGMEILENSDISVLSVMDSLDKYHLPFDKCVSLINFRDNGMYISNPIYISKKMFYYYISPEEILKFDAQDLFYYSSHKIMKRGKRLFVSEFGNQINIFTRYGIRPHSVLGRDYNFKNGDVLDFRIHNIEILNTYYGVSKCIDRGKQKYKAVLHIIGNYTVGHYDTPLEAAIAYNKAVLILRKKNCPKSFELNDIKDISKKEYEDTFNRLKVSKKILELEFD